MLHIFRQVWFGAVNQGNHNHQKEKWSWSSVGGFGMETSNFALNVPELVVGSGEQGIIRNHTFLRFHVMSYDLLLSQCDCEFLVQIPSFLSILLSSLVQVTYSKFLKNAFETYVIMTAL